MSSIFGEIFVDSLHRIAHGLLKLDVSNLRLVQLEHPLLQLYELPRNCWDKRRIGVNLFCDECHCFTRVTNCFLTRLVANSYRLLQVSSFRTTKFESTNSISRKTCEFLTCVSIRIGMLVHCRLKSNRRLRDCHAASLKFCEQIRLSVMNKIHKLRSFCHRHRLELTNSHLKPRINLILNL